MKKYDHTEIGRNCGEKFANYQNVKLSQMDEFKIWMENSVKSPFWENVYSSFIRVLVDFVDTYIKLHHNSWLVDDFTKFCQLITDLNSIP